MLRPAETVEIFERQAQPKKAYAAGEVIFREGETGHLMFGILDGEVEMSVGGKVVEILKRGDVFGVGALVHDDALRMSTAIAKTACTLASLDRKHFIFAVQETPLFALEVIRSYSDRFRSLKATY